jgi:hypothetical protein
MEEDIIGIDGTKRWIAQTSAKFTLAIRIVESPSSVQGG